MIDVMITSPATAHKVTESQTHMKPGRAAQLGYNAKIHKIADADETKFTILPFIIKTGGRIHEKVFEWLDSIAENGSIHARMGGSQKSLHGHHSQCTI